MSRLSAKMHSDAMTRAGRFACVLLTAVAGVACHSQNDLLTPQDGGAGSGGMAGARGGSGGASGGMAGARGGSGGMAGARGGGGGAGGGAGSGGSAGTAPAMAGAGGGAGAAPDGSPADVPDGSAADVHDDSAGDVRDDSTGGTVVCSDYPQHTDCTSAPGCETALGTATDCASCGDPSCAIANTLFSCTSANGCTSAVCAVGFANCDRTSPDCEAVIAAGGSCIPAYRGTVGYVTIRYGSAAAAIASDGSYFLGGVFTGTVQFGTPAAPDVMVAQPGDDYGFITRFNADGSYAWTRAFPSSGGVDIYGHEAPPAINGLAATPDGGVVAVGSYDGTIDLDPGDAVESHQTNFFGHREGFVVKLAADGTFAWGGTFTSQDIGSDSDAGAVVIDGTGGVIVGASFYGSVDLDPSAGTEVHTSSVGGGVLVKLTPAGALSSVQSAETGPPVPAAISMTLATDGSLWVLGGTDFAAFGPDGAPRGSWLFGDPDSLMSPRSIASGPNGSVYIGGGAWGLPDFDPGPGVVKRMVGTSLTGGFIVKLGSDGRFLWVQTLAGQELVAVAGAPDGGVIGLGSAGVTKLNADGTAGWTFSSGQFPGTVVSSGTTFVVTGSTGNFNGNFNASTDMDPGPGVDLIGAINLYLSRFSF